MKPWRWPRMWTAWESNFSAMGEARILGARADGTIVKAHLRANMFRLYDPEQDYPRPISRTEAQCCTGSNE